MGTYFNRDQANIIINNQATTKIASSSDQQVKNMVALVQIIGVNNFKTNSCLNTLAQVTWGYYCFNINYQKHMAGIIINFDQAEG